MPFWVHEAIGMVGAAKAAGRIPCGVAEFLLQPNPTALVLRRDVDRRPGQAVRLAEAESEAGVTTTYYFRCDRRGTFPAADCRRVSDLGHEVGYHHEELARSHGDRAIAIERFATNLERLRAIVPCVTVSMHGSPLSSHDNRSLLGPGDLARFGLLGDASTALDELAPIYFTDAGGSWNDPRRNFRDHIGTMEHGADPMREGTFAAHVGQPIYINMHPERWVSGSAEFLLALGSDWAAGAAKACITILRR